MRNFVVATASLLLILRSGAYVPRTHPQRTPSSLRATDQDNSPAAPPRFPTAATPPADVVRAQLAALAARDVPAAYALLSRGGRSPFEQGVGSSNGWPPPAAERAHARFEAALGTHCPGLLGHAGGEISAALTLHDPAARSAGGTRWLPRWCCRVRVRPARGARRPTRYLFTLTRQRGPAPDERWSDDKDGCWLVWKIAPDDGGGEESGVRPITEDGSRGRRLVLASN